MPPRSNTAKRPQDVTGRLAEKLQEEHKEELARRSEEIGLVNAVRVESLDDPIDIIPAHLAEARRQTADPASDLSEATEVVVEEPMVGMRVSVDLDDVTIGHGNTYSFKVGQKYRVPRYIYAYMDERGFVYH